jgi:hypothetical protein
MTLSAKHGTHGPSRLTYLENENARLRAEIERLRNALLTVVECDPPQHSHSLLPVDWMKEWKQLALAFRMKGIARAALAIKDNP